MKSIRRIKRAKSVRSKMTGTEQRPRLSVFRSNKHIYAQLIDDVKGITLVGVSDRHIDENAKKQEAAKALGLLLAQKAKDLKITSVIFDRGSYSYHGMVKALAEGVREGGLTV